MLCNCHVDILGGLACISHLCGSGCFVCFDYYGRPPVVISHFGGTFKMPSLQHRALLHSRDSVVRGLSVSGAVVLSFCQTLVLWLCVDDVCGTKSDQCVYAQQRRDKFREKSTFFLPAAFQLPSCFPRLHTQPPPLPLNHISTLLCSSNKGLLHFNSCRLTKAPNLSACLD